MRRALAGSGSAMVAAGPGEVWSALLDPEVLLMLIPAAERVERLDGGRYRAGLAFGVGRVRGRYEVGMYLTNLVPPHALDLAGSSRGLLGGGSATAHVTLTEAGPDRTEIAWVYTGVVTGPVALAGSKLLQASSRLFVHRFFAALARHMASGVSPERVSQAPGPP